MAAKPLSLAEQGRERQTSRLRTRIYWALVAMAMFMAIPLLLVADTPREVGITLGGMAISLFGAHWIAEFVMTPVYSLRRRLEVRNYGETPVESEIEEDIDLSADGLELGAVLNAFHGRRKIDTSGDLPVELAEIERLARAGRMSEIAMETVRRDLFKHLSHNLKNPMALLRAHAATAKDAFERAEPEAVVEDLEAIEAVSMNVSGLVEQILNLAWVDGIVREGLGGERANLSQAVTSTVGTRRRAAAEKGMTLEMNVEAGLWVKGRKALLGVMVESLIDNAIRYAPTDTTISIHARKLVGARRTVVVEVIDRGPGIPVQERKRVFDAFYGSMGLDERGNMTYGSRRDRALGTVVEKSHGLGLALVRSVADLHGAEISLDSGPGGVGLCARIILAMTSPPSELPPELHVH